MTTTATSTTTIGSCTGTSRRRGLRALGAAFIAALAVAPAAFAHGDPASHYLETGALYPSFARQPSVDVQLQLLGMLQAAERRSYPIKVALVAGEADLVEDLAPLKAPQPYAEFVASAIGRGLRAPVVIVTPYGIGVAGNALRDGRLRRITPADARALVGGVAVPPKADGDALARTAMRTIRNISRAGGHPLPADVPPAKQFVAPAGASPVAGGETATDSGSGGNALLTAVPAILVALAAMVAFVCSQRRTRSLPAAD